MAGEELPERIGVTRDVRCEQYGVVAVAVVPATPGQAPCWASFWASFWAHDLTVMSVISPLKPPEAAGSLVSQTSR